MPLQQSVQFSIVNAFTNSAFGGNPAVVLFLDAPLSDESIYLKIAQSFNQPIACYVFPIDNGEQEPDDTTKTFQIRWFTVSHETGICGHGTLAAAHVLLSRSEIVPPTVRVLRFKSMHGYVYARRIQNPNFSDRIEIELPAFDATPVEAKEFDRIREVIKKAFRRDTKVNFVGIAGSGEGGSGAYLLIELEEGESLEGVNVDIPALAETTYQVNIFTVKSQKPSVAYETRMFAPISGVPEDPVCGSANCLMAPYWANKLAIPSRGEMVAKQVSPRGGDLWVFVDRERRKVCLQGEAKSTMTGRFYM